MPVTPSSADDGCYAIAQIRELIGDFGEDREIPVIFVGRRVVYRGLDG
jgi:hypothetical protein